MDDSLLYCLDDGSALVQGSVTDEPKTAILSTTLAADEDATAVLGSGAPAQTTSLTLRLPSLLSKERLPWVLAGILAFVAIGALATNFRNSRGVRVSNEPIRSSFFIQPPQRLAGYGQLAISPDGRNIAVTANVEAQSAIWLRPADSLDGTMLAGTENVQGFPFWSPDGRSIGFFTPQKLKRLDLADGSVRELADIPPQSGGLGGTWSSDGTILVNGGGMFRVPATGGGGELLPGYAAAKGEFLRWPTFLPDGKHFVFLRTNNERTRSELYLGSTDGSERRLLFDSESNAVYSPAADGRGGYLLFARGGALLAQGFDSDNLAPIGEAFRVADRVRVNANSGASIAVSMTGTLIYDPITEDAERRQLTWYDRTGKEIAKVGQPGTVSRIKLSPDESSLIITRSSGPTVGDLLVTDVARGAATRLSSFPGFAPDAIWSPDSKFVVWNDNTDGKARVIRKLASGAGNAEILFESTDLKLSPTDWSPDGKFIIATGDDRKEIGARDIWVLPLDGERKPYPYIKTEFAEGSAVFSPDGRYVAYVSTESGRNEIYIQTFPASANRWPVSTNGGISPQWARTGKELFYVQSDGRVMSVAIKPGDPFGVGTPLGLFDITAVRSPRTSDFAVSNDAQRLLFISRAADAVSPPIVAILNWSAGVKK